MVFDNSAVVALSVSAVAGLWLLTRLGRREKDLVPNEFKTVLITGCDSGFGERLCTAAILEGFQVVAACYTQDGADRFKDTAVTTVVGDLMTKEGRAKIADAGEKAAGARGLYALVNNAGLCLPGNVAWLKPEVYEDTMNLNFQAPVELTYRLLPSLKAAKGRVINVTSVDGFIPLPLTGAYSCSKHALEAYSDILRCEMLHWGVSVVVIQPATMRTPLAMSFADKWLKSYHEAPIHLQEMYGDDWAEKIHAANKVGIESLAADPSETVRGLMIALQKSKPPTRIMTGKAAHWVWKPISHLSDTMRDTLLHRLTFSTHVPRRLEPKETPPIGVISHVTIRVKDLERSLEFYRKFGFEPRYEAENGQQYLRAGPRSGYGTMILLKQDESMAKHGRSHDVGYPRLAMYCTDLEAQVKRLSELGVEPIAPIAEQKGMAKCVVYQDPDGFIVYYVQMLKTLGFIMRCFNWRARDPILFHVNANVTKAEVGLRVFEKLGFKSMSDQNRDQVLNDMLPAFNLDPKTTVVEHIRLARLTGDSMIVTIMEWVNPKTQANSGTEDLNCITISVEDVDAALARAKEIGMVVTQSAEKRVLPHFGERLIGSALVEPGGCRIEFCCFER